MHFKYTIGQIWEDKFIYNLEICYNENDTKCVYRNEIIIDLINDYPNYIFIKNDTNYTYLTVYKRPRIVDNTYKDSLNIGDVKTINTKNIKSLHFNEYICNHMMFKETEQHEFDKYNYLTIRNTCNSTLYNFFYLSVLDYFIKLKYKNTKFKETIV